jgi:hypothetical protein
MAHTYREPSTNATCPDLLLDSLRHDFIFTISMRSYHSLGKKRNYLLFFPNGIMKESFQHLRKLAT